jgi:hypothetical protein
VQGIMKDIFEGGPVLQSVAKVREALRRHEG